MLRHSSFFYLTNERPQAGHSHSVKEWISRQTPQLGGQHRQRAENYGQEHGPGRDLSRRKEGQGQRDEHHRPPQSHGEEAEVVYDGPGDESGNDPGDDQDDHNDSPNRPQRLGGDGVFFCFTIGHFGGEKFLQNIVVDYGSHAQSEPGSAADDGDEQRADDDPGKYGRQVVEGEGRESLDRGFENGQVRKGQTGGSNGRRFRGEQVVGPHVQTNHHSGNSQRRHDQGADESPPAARFVALAGEDGLSVGLGGQNSQQEADAGADVLQRPSGYKA